MARNTFWFLLLILASAANVWAQEAEKKQVRVGIDKVSVLQRASRKIRGKKRIFIESTQAG